MTNILIRDVPEDVHATLQRRAEAAGQSLQQYLLAELARLSAAPTMAEVLARIERRTGGSHATFADTVHTIEEERGARLGD